MLGVTPRHGTYREGDSVGEPLVSVIMPNLNKGRFIREAIESVLNQSYSNLELIVVDGGSTDDSLSQISSHLASDRRVKLVIEPRRGAGRARNKGLTRARGDFVAFLDSDDLYEREKIEQQVSLFREDRVTSCCYTEARIIDGEGKATRGIYNSDLVKLPRLPEGRILAPLLRLNFIVCGTVMLRKECLSSGCFDQSVGFGEDWDLWVRLARKYRFRYISEPLYHYRIYEGNTYAAPDQRSNHRNIAAIHAKWLQLFDDLNGQTRTYLVTKMLKELRLAGDGWSISKAAASHKQALGVIKVGSELPRL